MNKWRSLAVILLLIAMAINLSCSKTERGSGVAVSEVRPLEAFTKIYADGAATLVLLEGDQYSVRVESEKNLLPLLSTAVINGQLVIQPLKPFSATKPIVYYVYLKKLEELHIAGTFDVLNESPLHFDKLKVDIDGACRLKLSHLEGDALEIKLSGVSSMEVKGVVDSQVVTLSGAADYSALDLASEKADIQISGTGEAILNVKNSLKVDISGTGAVSYKGAPQISSNVSGAGTIIKL